MRVQMARQICKCTLYVFHYCSDEDETSIDSTHTLTNGTFNDGSGKIQYETPCKQNDRYKQHKNEKSNEAISEQVSLSPSSSISDNSKNTNNAGNNGGCSTTLTYKHLQGDGRLAKANIICVQNDSDNVTRLSLDTLVPKRRKPPNKENNGRNCREKLTKVICTEAFVERISKRNHDSVSSSSSGGDNVVSETKYANDTKNKKKQCDSNRDATDEHGRNTHSSTRSSTEQSVRPRKMSAVNSLSISNSTLTNVNM